MYVYSLRCIAEAEPRTPELCEKVKAENARTFRERIRKLRTPVLSLLEIKSREHPYYRRIGSGPDCSVPGHFILATRLRSGGRAKRRLANARRGARAVRARNAWRGVRAVRARVACYLQYLISKTYDYFARHIIYTSDVSAQVIYKLTRFC